MELLKLRRFLCGSVYKSFPKQALVFTYLQFKSFKNTAVLRKKRNKEGNE